MLSQQKECKVNTFIKLTVIPNALEITGYKLTSKDLKCFKKKEVESGWGVTRVQRNHRTRTVVERQQHDDDNNNNDDDDDDNNDDNDDNDDDSPVAGIQHTGDL